DVGYGAVIGAACRTHLRFGGAGEPQADDVTKAGRMRILAAGKVANARHVDLVIAVAIPVGFGDDVRVVRGRHRGHEAEGTLVAAAGKVEQLLARGVDHFVVEIDLV